MTRHPGGAVAARSLAIHHRSSFSGSGTNAVSESFSGHASPRASDAVTSVVAGDTSAERTVLPGGAGSVVGVALARCTARAASAELLTVTETVRSLTSS